MKETMYDIVAVNLKTHLVRIMDENRSKANAEAYVNMAVMRRGVEEEFFVAVPHGRYDVGDKYVGPD